MSAFFKIKTFFNYWLDAVDEHSLHSPFLFDFYTKVVKREVIAITIIESLRKQLSNDHREIDVEDFGAGSKHIAGTKRKISDIARLSLSDAKFSTLYNRIAGYCHAKTILELGTSLGINTLYLAARPQSKVYSFEGSATIAEIASISFEFGGARNIELITGNLDNTLYATLSRIPKIDLAFMDANHRYEPTLHYFESILTRTHHKSIIILDDIHDTPEMEKAWNEIKRHPLVYTSADLFRCGIVFLDPSLNKQHVVLQF
ncbi:MAG: class I SAM-dependent methyltransferase [Cyclobacteriaceae bacterium]|nr:class I SAM-dependent methyltransferase [Cyclobacteriaceae bacterium]UYN85687.1 MAG: class I SAM-dependent methyltransferase [Cyclobacteriaceae bacterium]